MFQVHFVHRKLDYVHWYPLYLSPHNVSYLSDVRKTKAKREMFIHYFPPTFSNYQLISFLI